MKNIILLITDTFRYDNLLDRGERTVRTPELNKFGQERAVSVDGFYVGSFPTIPHRTDVATGVTGWIRYGWQPIDKSSPNHIAALLRQAGYVSQLICDCPHLFPARFDRAFDAAYQTRGQEGDVPLLHLNDEVLELLPETKTRRDPRVRGALLPNLHRWTNRYYEVEEDTFAARTGRAAIRWLEENYKVNPFFLWVDFFDPHEPWDPPEYMVRRYDPAYHGEPMFHPNYGPSDIYSENELTNLWAHYAAEAELVDRWLGRVLQKLDDLDLWDDSLVIITSDHGMSIGEHGRTGKSNIWESDKRFWPIYPEIAHVPFLIAGGELPQGVNRNFWAQAADILPTCCDLAGITITPSEPLNGRSFAQALMHGESHREHIVSGCHIKPKDGKIPPRATMPCLYKDSWAYIPVGAFGMPELYDLSSDPLGERDVASSHPKTIRELHDVFLHELRSLGADDGFMNLWSEKPGSGKGAWAVDYPQK